MCLLQVTVARDSVEVTRPAPTVEMEQNHAEYFREGARMKCGIGRLIWLTTLGNSEDLTRAG
jgi:hypothetical protein